MNSTNSIRIAKNTLLLYFRMIITMALSLYMVRILLNTLGVIDFGIYNVVGGIVALFSFLSATMASASQRFFAYELGRKSESNLNRIFSLSVIIYLSLALVIFVFAETIGVWFLNKYMIIPYDRLASAKWVYQFSIFSFIFSILIIPYTSMLIAHEDMKLYAFISLFEVVLKFVFVLVLTIIPFDKLKIYSILTYIATLIISFCYCCACIRKYKECKFKLHWDKKSFKSLLSYSGWNMLGALANMFKIYGSNILLNLFFGPVVNAARGIAFQVNAALNSFITNFYMAVRPQITKAYSGGDKEQMFKLVFKSAKFSYFLVFLLSMPVLLETQFIMNLWLKKPPEGTVLFVKLLIVNLLIEAINNQLVAALQAIGNIKLYQIVISSMLLLILPISYVFYHFGASPEITFYVSIVITIICFIPQLLIARKVISISITSFFKKVIWVAILVSVLSLIIPLIIYYNMPFGLLRFFIVSFSGLISCGFFIFYLGLTENERISTISIVKNKIFNKANR